MFVSVSVSVSMSMSMSMSVSVSLSRWLNDVAIHHSEVWCMLLSHIHVPIELQCVVCIDILLNAFNYSVVLLSHALSTMGPNCATIY